MKIRCILCCPLARNPQTAQEEEDVAMRILACHHFKRLLWVLVEAETTRF